MTTIKQLEILQMKVEVEYFSILSMFQDVFKKYHEAILLEPISPDNTDSLKVIYEGLLTLQASFDNIVEAFQVICQSRLIDIT
jgi:hypothetical protein